MKVEDYGGGGGMPLKAQASDGSNCENAENRRTLSTSQYVGELSVAPGN